MNDAPLGPLLPWPQKLHPGVLLHREKRFLATVRLESGEEVDCHCPNTGRLPGLVAEGTKVMVSEAAGEGRRLTHTWQLAHSGSSWVCVNTQLANTLFALALEERCLADFSTYESFTKEVVYPDLDEGGTRSRADFQLLEGGVKHWVEIKSVSMIDEEGAYAFPDAVTARGLRHLIALEKRMKAGEKASLVFLALREDGDGFRVARKIDESYARKWDAARKRGLPVYVYSASVTEEGVRIRRREDLY